MKIVVLTAVPNEFEVLRKLLIEKRVGETLEDIDGAYFYEHISVPIDGVECTIILGITGQGNVEASIYVMDALNRYKPDLFLFAGTCGGVKDVKVGDTVIVTNVFDIFRGKESNQWGAKPSGAGMNSALRGICTSIMMQVNRGEKLKNLYVDVNSHVFMGDIGSSSAIVAAEKSKIRDMLYRNYANVIAVEMEGYGFYKTLKENNYNAGILVRAVTDDSISKEDDSDREIQPEVMKKVYFLVYEIIRKYISNNKKKQVKDQN